MPLWGKDANANSAPKFVTDAKTGETGIQEYGTDVFYVNGSEGYPVAPGWARRVTKGSRVYWESLVTVRAPEVAPYHTYLTAGALSAFRGYQPGQFGSISREPITGQTMNFFAYNTTNGSLTFVGDITGLLAGKKIYIDGVEVTTGTGWTFGSGTTNWIWSGTTPPQLVTGQVYLIEIK